MSRRRLLFLVCAALTACSPMAADAGQRQDAAAAPVRHPQSGLEVVPLAIVSAGKRHAFRVEVARTGPEQARGLMFRTALGPDEGMLFPMEPNRHASFWMKNTVIPLDILFVGPDRRILNIAADTTPYSEAPIPSAGMTSAVLELGGGRAAQLGIRPGDRVEW